MKVLFSLTYYHPYVSGLTLYIERLAEQLAKKHRVRIITLRYSQSLEKEETYNTVYVLRAEPTLKVSKGFLSLEWIWISLREILQTDVVIISLPQVEGILPAFFGKLFGKKVITIYHCEVILPESSFNRLVNTVVHLMNYLCLLFSDRVVTYTQDFAKHSRLLHHFENKCEYVYPPIYVPKINNRVQKYIKDKIGKNAGFIIGVAARLAAEKGIEYLLEAIPQIQTEMGNKKFTIVLAGSIDPVGEEKYKQRILGLIKEYAEFIVLLGEIPPQSMGSFYSLIDVLVLPSINSTESFGMVQVEAMMMGVPVITTDLPGVRMVVRETRMGEIVPPKDSQQLSRAISKILQNKKKIYRTFRCNPYHFFTREDNPVLRKNTMQLVDFLRLYVRERPVFLSFLRAKEAYLYQNYLPLKRPVLDVGCGDGFFAQVVLSQNKMKDIDIGLDVKESRIEEARNLGIYKKLVIYDGKKIPYPDNHFTTVISNSVFEHVADLDVVLKEIHRVMKPGGIFITTVMAKPWEKNLFFSIFFGKSYERWMRKKQVHINLLSKQQWDNTFQKRGLRIEKIIGHLTPEACRWIDLLHYVSIPNIVSHLLFSRWVIFSFFWEKVFSLEYFISLISKNTEPQNSGAIFYVLRK